MYKDKELYADIYLYLYLYNSLFVKHIIIEKNLELIL